MSSKEPAAQVTLREIAGLAQVTLPTVSNWRRRHDDFPTPRGENDKGRPVFDLVEVNVWLSKNGRLPEDANSDVELWNALNDLRGESYDDRRARAIICQLAALSSFVRSQVSGPIDRADLHQALRVVNGSESLLQGFTDLEETPAQVAVFSRFATIDAAVLEDVFSAALDRGEWKDDFRTPLLVQEIIARLVAQQDSVAAILDPAAGSCGLLDAACSLLEHRADLAAQEVNQSQRALGRQRLAFKDLACDFELGDSLWSDAFAGRKFDAVVADPPFGMRFDEPLPIDDRWLPGVPPGKSADSAWLQHCLSHVGSDGNAYVVTGAGLAFRSSRGEVALRRELVKRGIVEALIALPGALRRSSRIATVLWVLRSPETAREGEPVLFVSVESAPKNESQAASIAEQIAHVVGRWREAREVINAEGLGIEAVPALDLLDREVDLRPVRWIREEVDVSDLELWADTAAAAPERLAALTSQERVFAQAGEPTQLPGPVRSWVPVADLIREGQLTLISAVPRRSDEISDNEGAVELVRVSDLNSQRGQQPGYLVDGSDVKPAQLTEPGDVLFAATNGIHAWVEDRGGRVPVAPLRGLRIHGDWITPRVLRFVIGSERNQRLTTGTVAMTVKPKLLQVPALPADQLQALDAWLETLERAERWAAATQETVSSAKLSLSRLMSAELRN